METILHNLVQATGWSILHSLWQGALIYALLLPFQSRFFKLSANLKYTLAYIANCLILLCFITTFLSVFHWPADLSTTKNFATQPVILPSVIPLTLAQYIEQLFPYLVMLYSAGLIIQSFIVVNGYRKIQTLKNAGYTKISGEWQHVFDNLTKHLNIRKHIDFRLSDHVSVPLVIGFFKPVILFPIALAAQMDIKQVEAILIHELSHIRRNDYFFNLIRTIIDTIMFFNPFVWLTGRFIDIEREHSCDDLVVKITDTPLTYAHALLRLEILTDKHTPVFALAATGTNQHLYQRIKRITDMKTNYTNSKQKLFAVTLTIATIVSLAWINPAKKEKKPTIQRTVSVAGLAGAVPIDTGKKKIKKIIILKNVKDSDAVSTHFSDTTKKNRVIIINSATPDMYINTEPSMRLDSILTPEVTANISNFVIRVKDMVLSNPANQEELKKVQAQLEKQGKELSVKFNSREQQAKWKKYAKDMQAKYDNPKEREKWEKYAKEVEFKYNSPEERAKWKKYAEDVQMKYNDPKERAKWVKLAEETYSPEQKEMIIKVQKNASIQIAEAQKVMNNPDLKNLMQVRINGNMPNLIFTENEDARKIKQTPEYIELKKKFDKDVEDLVNKKLKKENN